MKTLHSNSALLPAPSPRCANRARIALREAADEKALLRAIYRLLLATVPGAFVSVSLQFFRLGPSIWISSHGLFWRRDVHSEIVTGHSVAENLWQRPGLKVLPTHGALPPEEELLQLPFYQKLMKRLNWRHAVSLCLWRSIDPPQLETVISIHRSAEQGDFSDEEIKRFATLHPAIERAWWRVAGLEKERATWHGIKHLVRELGPPSVVLDENLRPVFHTRSIRSLFAQWREGATARWKKSTRGRLIIPDEILAVCREIKATWMQQLTSHGAASCCKKQVVTSPVSPSLAATVKMLKLDSARLSPPSFLITISEPADTVRTPSSHSRRSLLATLSPSEREVAMLAAGGGSNAEIAVTLGRSVGTVKSELHAAFKKLAVANRVQLAAALRRM